jgi:hypothetical protein
MKLLVVIGFALLVGVTLGALGGGGSALIVPGLQFGLDIPHNQAVRLSQAIVGTTSLFACLFHLPGGDVRLRTAGLLALSGIGGAELGKAINQCLSTGGFNVAFATILVAIGVWMLLGRPVDAAGGAVDRGATPRDWKAGAMLVGRALLLGLLAGALTGLFGVGGGLLIVPALTALNVPMRQAVGTSLAVVAFNCGYSFLTTPSVPIDWTLGAAVVCGAIPTSYVAARLVRRAPSTAQRRVFAVLVLVVAGLILVETIRSAF